VSEPLVSVIIPAYNQAEYLGEAIRSVLNQSYANLEAIVVNDASPDDSEAVVASFSDERLRYIVHERNRMLAATRNTGMRAARGEILAVLDGDDYFDREKVAQHVAFLTRHPEVSVTYNNRWDLQYSSTNIRNYVRVPATVGLADLVVGFPFCPSDMVVRREQAYAVGLFDESFLHFSEDMDFNCRLALAGCQFAGIDRCLNFRRFHSGRVIRNPRQRLEAALRSLNNTFSDERTPPEVHAVKGRAYSDHYLVWAIEALRQENTETGLEWLRQSAAWRPAVVEGHPNDITTFLVYDTVHDDAEDHAQTYKKVVQQLRSAAEFASVVQQAEWGIARGWLVKAYRLLIWGSRVDGRACLQAAARAGAVVDRPYINEVIHQLLGRARECGQEAAEASARLLDEEFRAAMPETRLPSFVTSLGMGQAYEAYRSGRYHEVSAPILRAMRSDPRLLAHRGSVSMLLRSSLRTWREQSQYERR